MPRFPSLAVGVEFRAHRIVRVVTPKYVAEKFEHFLFGELTWFASVLLLAAFFSSVAFFWFALSASLQPLLVLLGVALSSGYVVRVSSLDRQMWLGLGGLIFTVLFPHMAAPELLVAWFWGTVLGRWVTFCSLAKSLKNCLTMLPGAVLTVCFLAGISSVDASAVVAGVGGGWWQTAKVVLVLSLALIIYVGTALFVSTVQSWRRYGVTARVSLLAFSWSRILGLLGFSLVLSLGIQYAAEVLTYLGMASDPTVAAGRLIVLVSLAGFGIVERYRRVAETRRLRGLIRVSAVRMWDSPSSDQAGVLQAMSLVFPEFLVSTTVADSPAHYDRLISREISAASPPFQIVVDRGPFRRPFTGGDRALLDAAAAILDRALRTRQTVSLLDQRASTDALTGVLNFGGLQRVLNALTVRRLADPSPVALIFLDIDNFKGVNDQFGHDAGDRVLRAVSSRLRRSVRQGDVVARIGGDEFVVIVSGQPAREEAERIVQRLDAIMVHAPVNIGARAIEVRLSHGIAVTDRESRDLEMLIHEADKQMYAARGLQLAGLDPMDTLSVGDSERLLFRGKVRLATAIAHGNLAVAYQPVVDVCTGTVHSVEALVRYEDVVLGEVSASEILAGARAANLLDELTNQVFSQSVKDMEFFRQICPALHELHVNIEVNQLLDEGFVDRLDALRGSHPEICLILELNERTIHGHGEKVLDEIRETVRVHALTLAIDDLGKDFASFSAVIGLPVTVAKVDKNIVDQYRNPRATHVVRHLVRLFAADELDLELIFEGVETAEQKQFLVDQGARFIQGFHYSAPLSRDAFADYLRAVEGSNSGGVKAGE